MSKEITEGNVGGEAGEFIEAILCGLEDNRWLKKSLKHLLKLSPGEAHDEALILYKTMQMRANEADGRPLDEN